MINFASLERSDPVEYRKRPEAIHENSRTSDKLLETERANEAASTYFQGLNKPLAENAKCKIPELHFTARAQNKWPFKNVVKNQGHAKPLQLEIEARGCNPNKLTPQQEEYIEHRNTHKAGSNFWNPKEQELTEAYPFGLNFPELKKLLVIDEYARWRSEHPTDPISKFDPDGFEITCSEAADLFAASEKVEEG